jgi:3-deoxy-D-manno-octulosonic acid kinase
MQIEPGGSESGKDMRDIEPVEIQQAGQHILYDASLATQLASGESGFSPDAQSLLPWFDSAYWRERGNLKGEAQGRGSAFFFEYRGRQFALRHYRRGGMVARFVTDRYVWTGLRDSRPWREWRLLAAACEKRLPVPKPFAARLIKNGVFYTADLITRRIDGGVSLAESLTAGRRNEAAWRDIGEVIRRFHDEGIEHADLNAHNILLAGDEVFLIDFDNGKIHEPRAYRNRSRGWRERNLRRLRRSLNKLRDQRAVFHFSDADWRHLLEGYGAGGDDR